MLKIFPKCQKEDEEELRILREISKRSSSSVLRIVQYRAAAAAARSRHTITMTMTMMSMS
jgi:hypothetical protein